MPSEILSGDLEILRGDLSRILYDASRDGAEYVFDDSITAVSQHEDGVDVTFERGAKRTFDLVVGADGLHSRVRERVFGEEARFMQHLGYYVAIFTTRNHLGLDRSGLFFSVPGKVAGIYSARDNSEAKALFYFASSPLAYEHRDLDA